MYTRPDGRPIDEPLGDDDHSPAVLPGHQAERPGQQPVHTRSVTEIAQRQRTAKQASQLAQQVCRKFDPRLAVGPAELMACFRFTVEDLTQVRGLTPDTAWEEVQRHRRAGSLRNHAPDRLRADELSGVVGRVPRTLKRWIKSGLIPDAMGADRMYSQRWASGLASIVADIGIGEHRTTQAQRDQIRLRAHQLADELRARDEL